jgi:hypothetical protein
MNEKNSRSAEQTLEYESTEKRTNKTIDQKSSKLTFPEICPDKVPQESKKIQPTDRQSNRVLLTNATEMRTHVCAVAETRHSQLQIPGQMEPENSFEPQFDAA